MVLVAVMLCTAGGGDAGNGGGGYSGDSDRRPETAENMRPVNRGANG